jgi:hypothetical protein
MTAAGKVAVVETGERPPVGVKMKQKLEGVDWALTQVWGLSSGLFISQQGGH